MSQSEQLNRILQDQFGFSSFRPGQQEAIELLLKEKRLLVIQPTGHGKSLLYQLPSCLLPGLTLVISPLLALIRDQVDHLTTRFKIPAAAINSDQSEQENENAIYRAANGQLKILFIAPERLDNLATYEFLLSLNVSLLVVDEAHCISTWGHDFRPSYRQIIHAVHAFEAKIPDIHVLGLTATADDKTEKDIAAQLNKKDVPLTVVRESMDRSNISLHALNVANNAEKLVLLDQMLGHLEGSGILYCATREQTEGIASYLKMRGHDVVAYHAGFDSDQKRHLQSAFIQGKHKAISATNALGMGIDKPDIRFIIHVDVPGSVTAYYQEVGRAGRDGLPAQGFLLFAKDDRKIQDHFIRSAQPTAEDFHKILNSLGPDAEGTPPNATLVKARSGLHPTRVTVVMAELGEQGFVEKVKVGRKQGYVHTQKQGMPNLERYERQHQVRVKELNAMLTYGEGQVQCRMMTLRTALGDLQAVPCQRCDLCKPVEKPRATPELVVEAQRWLQNKDVVIPASRIPVYNAGLAVFAAELRSPLFIKFMHSRAKDQEVPGEVLAEIMRVAEKMKTQRFTAIVPLPSYTWAQRQHLAHVLSNFFNVPVRDFLAWRERPQKRQGELLNNEQRKANIKDKMRLCEAPHLLGDHVLLLDDYFGSGATLKEAVRLMRKSGGYKGDFTPFTVAKLKWKLGSRGFV